MLYLTYARKYDKNNRMKTNFKKLNNSQIEIEFELEVDEFSKYVEKALNHLKEHVKIDGFRQGNVPLKIVEEKVGNENLLMEAGDLAVKESYQKFIKENNIEPIGNTQVEIKKIAKGSPMEFKITVSAIPQIELPDYKEVASGIKIREISVEPQEIDDAINYLQKSRAKISQQEKAAENKDFVAIEYQNESINNGKEVKDQFILGEGGFMKDFEENIIGMKAEDQKEFSAKFPDNHPDKSLAGKDAKFKVKVISVNKVELPEINDDFAKSMGAFDTLVSLKESIKEGINVEKKEEERHRRRGEIMEKISEKINFDVPQVMVEYEEKRLFDNFKSQIDQNLKISFEEYLSSIKKSEEEIRGSFNMEAKKRIKDFLVLREIGRKENIQVSDEEIEKKTAEFMKTYSKEEISKIDINQIKEYTKDTLFNEKVFQILENFSK